MKFDDVIKAISIAVQARIPVLLTGSVGEAKTSIVESLFRRLCVDHQTSIVALHEPPEYGGYPAPTEDGVRMLPVGWVRRLAQVEDPQKIVGLFLDELSNGSPATRSAAMRGVVDGTWGECHVPRLTTVAAMNPPDLAESGYELSAPLATRFCHIDWDMPESYWIEKLMRGFPEPEIEQLPADWEKHLGWARTLVIAFGRARPGALKTLPASRSDRSRPFPTYRTWTYAIQLLAACRACRKDLEHDVTVSLVAGCVGEQGAAEFLAFATTMDLPDPESVLANPDKLQLPERSDRAYAVLTAVTMAVLENKSQERWRSAWKVLGKAAQQERVDIAAGAAKALAEVRDRSWRVPPEIDAFIPMLREAGVM